MTNARVARSVLVSVAAALTAGWLLAACGDNSGSTTDSSVESTTDTTETTENTDGDNTIEIPSPSISVPSPSLPEVTLSPAP